MNDDLGHTKKRPISRDCFSVRLEVNVRRRETRLTVPIQNSNKALPNNEAKGLPIN
jgi:hypothetical protein